MSIVVLHTSSYVTHGVTICFKLRWEVGVFVMSSLSQEVLPAACFERDLAPPLRNRICRPPAEAGNLRALLILPCSYEVPRARHSDHEHPAFLKLHLLVAKLRIRFTDFKKFVSNLMFRWYHKLHVYQTVTIIVVTVWHVEVKRVKERYLSRDSKDPGYLARGPGARMGGKIRKQAPQNTSPRVQVPEWEVKQENRRRRIPCLGSKCLQGR